MANMWTIYFGCCIRWRRDQGNGIRATSRRDAGDPVVSRLLEIINDRAAQGLQGADQEPLARPGVPYDSLGACCI
ncbi:hypothetical protein [Streptomyces sp. enrichment culture]|uniref:hypothetical protein n=1 Tax=Streptomyces sp. enrichment culture TaxID=1795815 RepID=UPI003F55EF75